MGCLNSKQQTPVAPIDTKEIGTAMSPKNHGGHKAAANGDAEKKALRESKVDSNNIISNGNSMPDNDLAENEEILKVSLSSEIESEHDAVAQKVTVKEPKSPKSKSKHHHKVKSLATGDDALRKGAKPERVRRLVTTVGERDHNLNNERNSNAIDMTPHEDVTLKKIIRNHFLFKNGVKADEDFGAFINVAFDHLTKEEFKAGQTVFNKGDVGKCMYMITSGKFLVTLPNISVQLDKQKTFGELALIYKCPRTATVTCAENGVVWKIGAAAFLHLMENISSKNEESIMNFLQKDPDFMELSQETRESFIQGGNCTYSEFNQGSALQGENEPANAIHIVMSGTVSHENKRGMPKSVSGKGQLIGGVETIFMRPPDTRQSLCADKNSSDEGDNKYDSVNGELKYMQTRRAKDKVVCLAISAQSLKDLFQGADGDNVKRIFEKKTRQAVLNDATFYQKLLPEQQDSFLDTLTQETYDSGMTAFESKFVIVKAGKIFIAGEEQPLGPGSIYGASHLAKGSKIPPLASAEDGTVVLTTDSDAVSAKFSEMGYAKSLSEVIRLNDIKRNLNAIFLFKSLSETQVDRIARALEPRAYAKDEFIVQQGEDSLDFFLIQKGRVAIKKGETLLRNLDVWDYFGERGLLMSEKRSADCQAVDVVTCLVLNKKIFLEIVGPFKNHLEKRMRLQDDNIKMEDLRTVKTVGRGTFGIVKKVVAKADPSRIYALKCVTKSGVIRMKQEKSIKIEREVMFQCYHPCIVQSIKTFKDRDNIYFLTEFLGGGDLFFTIREIGMLSVLQSQFYSASLILAIGYLHERNIMYRDLKPENVLLDASGWVKLVDFGCCKKHQRAYTLVGTPEYLAPEVILGKGYSCTVDWWSIGVMLYEFVAGPLPFGSESDDQLELFREILEHEITFMNYVTDQAAKDIILGLLKKDPDQRLGSGNKGQRDIMEHEYYTRKSADATEKPFDFDMLLMQNSTPPWVPKTVAGEGSASCSSDSSSSDESDDDEEPLPPASNSISTHDCFNDF
eukprot:gene1324-370_t